MKIALLTNLKAGGGRAARGTERLLNAWKDQEIVGVAGYGGEALPQALPAPREEGFLPRLKEAVRVLAAQQPDLMAVIGGDGTAAYAAQFLWEEGARIPLFGLPGGTANVGPIIRAREEIPAPETLEAVSYHALALTEPDGTVRAFAFNDVVFGNTFLGTQNGSMGTFSAAALVREGRMEPAGPLPDLGQGLRILRNGAEMPLPEGPKAQLILSPLNDNPYYGKAVSGILCCTPDSPFGAAALLSPWPLVSFDEKPEWFSRWFTGAQLLLREEDRLLVSGLDEAVYAVMDGNPWEIGPGGVGVRCIRDAVTVLK